MEGGEQTREVSPYNFAKLAKLAKFANNLANFIYFTKLTSICRWFSDGSDIFKNEIKKDYVLKFEKNSPEMILYPIFLI